VLHSSLTSQLFNLEVEMADKSADWRKAYEAARSEKDPGKPLKLKAIDRRI